ncbi:ferredoxin--nitrite reductase NasD [Gottschalkia purinilytica]|uniref:Ferredoxin--nitrite reductase NasD n=1 Tax=Gottschalkia purinilytica TaxID=1503 RepID=A0A0L0W7P2_GOTPU|nr:nitrite/sulfite reductase [Gottschalkia purinilytica]KNF07325.1 ferredoxin--nitrite reductase NasD [Gottschalkia purinilytica]
MFKAPEYTKSYIENYEAKVKEYQEKGEKEVPFKSFGAVTGVYQERSGTTYMVRPRTPGGIITLKQLKKVSEVADKYSHGEFRFTTRQDIQFHKVTIENTIKIMKELIPVNVYTVGTGGNTARNVACSPLSGVEKDEAFDVTQYAMETTNYVVKDENSCKFPRKFKIAYSNNEKDTGSATFADLGFVAKIENGKKLFEVYGGGGFGSGPRMSLKLEDSIEPKDVLYYVEAMKQFFYEEGDRENRHKARVRHIVHRLGEEEFKDRFNRYLEEARKLDNLELNIEEKQEEKPWRKSKKIDSNIVSENKIEGLYSIYIHPKRGNISTSNLNKIIDFIDKLEYEVSIRLSPTQGFYIRDLNGEDAEKLLNIVKDFVSTYDIDNSISCVGADTCRVGVNSSQTLLKSIIDRFKDVDDNIKSQLPRVFISGCPSSCGQHQRGIISFSGKIKKIDGEVVPIYSVYFGGKVGAGVATLAERYGDIIGSKVPEFLYDVANLKKDLGYEDFEKLVDDRIEDLKELISKYSV